MKEIGYSGQALPFLGTELEAHENWATHNFGQEDRCVECDCRPWGAWACYPCGNADTNKTTVYEMKDGRRVWVKTQVVKGQEIFVGIYDEDPGF